VTQSVVWQVIAGCTVVTAAIKGAGPFALGGRDLHPRLLGVVVLLAPALLAALVVTQALANGKHVGVGPTRRASPRARWRSGAARRSSSSSRWRCS
jgi:branched-subunit amino acid transport protein